MGRKRVTPQDRELIGKEFTSSLVRSDLPDVVWVVRCVYVPSNGMYDNQKLVTCYTRGGKGDATSTPRGVRCTRKPTRA